jgi:hypothetical protein
MSVGQARMTSPVLHGERLRRAQRIERQCGEFDLGGLEPVDGGDDRFRI